MLYYYVSKVRMIKKNPSVAKPWLRNGLQGSNVGPPMIILQQVNSRLPERQVYVYIPGHIYKVLNVVLVSNA